MPGIARAGIPCSRGGCVKELEALDMKLVSTIHNYVEIGKSEKNEKSDKKTTRDLPDLILSFVS